MYLNYIISYFANQLKIFQGNIKNISKSVYIFREICYNSVGVKDMSYERYYIEENLRIYYCSIEENEEGVVQSRIAIQQHSDYYRLIYVKSDKTTVVFNDSTFVFNEPILITAKPRKFLSYRCDSRPCMEIRMQIHPNVYKNIQDDEKVLDFFYKLIDENSIFKLNEPQNSELNTCLDFIIEGVFAKCGSFAMKTRVNMLVAQLNFIYESQYKEYIASTDNIAVQIMDYIEKHFLENITAKTVSEKFFVSYNTINTIVKTCTEKTFGEFITTLRLEMANRLIESGHHQLSDVAKLSGFRNYPSFFTSYKNHFGIAPSKAFKKDLPYWPLKK